MSWHVDDEPVVFLRRHFHEAHDGLRRGRLERLGRAGIGQGCPGSRTPGCRRCREQGRSRSAQARRRLPPGACWPARPGRRRAVRQVQVDDAAAPDCPARRQGRADLHGDFVVAPAPPTAPMIPQHMDGAGPSARRRGATARASSIGWNGASSTSDRCSFSRSHQTMGAVGAGQDHRRLRRGLGQALNGCGDRLTGCRRPPRSGPGRRPRRRRSWGGTGP